MLLQQAGKKPHNNEETTCNWSQCSKGEARHNSTVHCQYVVNLFRTVRVRHGRFGVIFIFILMRYDEYDLM